MCHYLLHRGDASSIEGHVVVGEVQGVHEVVLGLVLEVTAAVGRVVHEGSADAQWRDTRLTE